MNMRTKRTMRLAVMTVGFAGLFAVLNAIPGAATPVSPPGSFVGQRLAHGHLSQGSLAVEPGLEIVVTRNAVKPGGTSGWHSHPGGAIVVIQTGQVTTYRKAGESGCAINTYTAGQSFIEQPGEPLNAKNNGSTETIIYATFPGVPLGPEGTTLQRTDEPNPGTCPV